MSQHATSDDGSRTQSQFELKSFNPNDFNARHAFLKISNRINMPIKREHPRATTGILAKYEMSETDFVRGTSATLQQEMHLARRACWSNNKNNSKNNNTNNNNNNYKKEKPKRKASPKDTKCCDIIESDDELERESFSVNKIKTNKIVTTNDIDKGRIRRNYKDYDNDDDVDNNDDDNDNERCGIEIIETALYGANVTHKKTPNAFPDANADSQENIVSPSANILNKKKSNVNKSIKGKLEKIQVPDSIENEIEARTRNANNENPSHEDNDPHHCRDIGDGGFPIRLFKLWLAFIAFCDSITIKSDDPRFDGYGRSRTTKESSTKKQERQEQEQTCATMTSKYRLFKSKKFILLFVVCSCFAFLDRIDARPNSSVISNHISDPIRNGDDTQKETIPEVAKLTLATNPTESVLAALPLASNVIPKKHIAENNPVQEETRHVILSSPDDEEIPHPDRYPVSQVDFGRVKTPFIIGIWILSASIAKIGFHMTPKLHLIFPESCLLIVVGVAIGVVLYMGTNVAVSPLTPNTFFFYMLPPIILDAGYFMPNRLFFDNLGTILLMAVVGTIFNIATIGGALYACGVGGIYGDQSPKLLDIFLFASLISAVDPVAVLAVFEEIHVNEILYIVVFGESLLNDAVTVVMYHMMEVYNEIGISKIIAQDIVSGVGSFFVVAIGGTVIGIIWGFLTGLVTRFTDHVRVIEPIFIFVMAYLAYLNAEIFHMSGILAITFCGITMKNYVESNISQKSHTTVKYALKMLSSSSETIIFMFLGVATVNNNHVWNTWFVILTIVFCSVFRVLGVILLTAIANRFRLHKLSRVDQFVMSYGGLRGAVAFALVLLVDERVVKDKNMFVTTTIAVIYFTVFIQGITIKPLVKFLNVKRANKRKPTMNERIHERFMDHLMAGIEDIVGKTGNYNVRDKFKRFDNRFIRPLIIRDSKQGAEPKIMETYSKLTMRDAMEVMRRNPSTIGQISGTESMSALFRNYTNNCIGGSPSLTNLDNTCSRNLDMHELDYNPSKKDLTDAKIHHLLAEELKPYRRASQQMHRRLSYSRHAVDDRDLSTQVNYKMQMNFRRMFNDRKHHKRSKRGSSKQPETVKQNHVSFHDFQQNGSTKQFSHDEQLAKATEANVLAGNEDWDDGLTFTAKSSLAEYPIPEEDRHLHGRDSDGERRVSTPTAMESQLPWKRQGDEIIAAAVQQNEFPAWASNKEYLAYNSPSATFLGGINKPKQPKSVIGLFRRESCGSKGGGSINEVSAGSDPALAAALACTINVPSATAAATHNPRLDKRSLSISAASGASGANDSGHSGPFAVTASHRRNVRRGSMLELTGDTIPEETHTHAHAHSKSLCEPIDDDDDWNVTIAAGGAGLRHERTNSGSSNVSNDRLLRGGREPLLPRLTPRAQIKRGMSAPGPKNQVTTALLSTSNSDYDDDDSEDFDLYDDESIVVTTLGAAAAAGGNQNGNNAANDDDDDDGDDASTMTAIRMTRNNDESII